MEPDFSLCEPGTPIVSIGLPVYNGERFLREAVDALLAQTLSSFELVISDNASTDGTAAICAEYAARDARVRVLHQQNNVGLMRNWNLLVGEARGRYFKWSSANDLCEPTLLERCVEALENDPEAVLCYGRSHLISEDGQDLGAYPHDFELTAKRPSDRYHGLLLSLFLNNAITGVVRTAVLRRTRLLRLYPGGDIPLMQEIALAGTILLAPEAVAYRRMGGGYSGNLSKAELMHLINPAQGSRIRLMELRRVLDRVATITGAPIPATEKLRALGFAARHSYWDIAQLAKGMFSIAAAGIPMS